MQVSPEKKITESIYTPRQPKKTHHQLYNVITNHQLHLSKTLSNDSSNILSDSEQNNNPSILNRRSLNIFSKSSQKQINLQNSFRRDENDMKVRKRYEVVGFQQFMLYAKKMSKWKQTLNNSFRRTGVMQHKNSRLKLFKEKLPMKESFKDSSYSGIDKENLFQLYSYPEQSKDLKSPKKQTKKLGSNEESYCQNLNYEPEKSINVQNIILKKEKRRKTLQEENGKNKIHDHRKKYQLILERTQRENIENILPLSWQQSLRNPLSLRKFVGKRKMQKIDHKTSFKAKGINKRDKQLQWLSGNTQVRFSAIDSNHFNTKLVRRCEEIEKLERQSSFWLRKSKLLKPHLGKSKFESSTMSSR